MTGWAIGTEGDAPETHGKALYEKLKGTVLPLFHRDWASWTRVMKQGGVIPSHPGAAVGASSCSSYRRSVPEVSRLICVNAADRTLRHSEGNPTLPLEGAPQ